MEDSFTRRTTFAALGATLVPPSLILDKQARAAEPIGGATPGGEKSLATRSEGDHANPYPVDHRLGRDHPPHPFEYIPSNQQNAIVRGRSNYDAAPDLQRMLDGWNAAHGKAGVEDFPVGVFCIGEPLRFPNWLSWRGQGRGTQLKMLSDHTGPVAFAFDSDPPKAMNGPGHGGDPSSFFNQALIGFDINANDAPAVKDVIYAPSWNEKCGLYNILIRNVPGVAVRADEFHGGSSGWAIEHTEIMCSSTSPAAIRLIGRTRTGILIGNRPQIRMNNVSIIGGTVPAENAAAGFVAIDNDNVHLQFAGGVHVERAFAAVTLAHNATLAGFGLTGSNNGGRVRFLVVRASTHTGQIDLADAFNEGATAACSLRDNKAKATLTRAIGGRIQVPSYPGTAWADGSFSVADMAIAAPFLRGLSNVARAATGYYKVIHADAFNSGEDYSVVCEAHDDDACYAVARVSERTGESFFVRVRRQSDDIPFDPARVTLWVYRRPGL